MTVNKKKFINHLGSGLMRFGIIILIIYAIVYGSIHLFMNQTMGLNSQAEIRSLCEVYDLKDEYNKIIEDEIVTYKEYRHIKILLRQLEIQKEKDKLNQPLK